MRLNIDEALRYLNIRCGNSLSAGSAQEIEMRRKTEKMAEMLCFMVEPKYIYRVLAMNRSAQGFELEGTDIVLSGELAEKMLSDSSKAVLVICTLGIKFDSMLRTEQVRDMSNALILDACGSALVEAGCDSAEQEIASRMKGMYLTDRFSPGYGDLPLVLQEKMSRALNAEKMLGIHLTDSMLFNPSKTVSAIIGLADTPQPSKIKGCAHCTLRDNCEFKKGGGSCGK